MSLYSLTAVVNNTASLLSKTAISNLYTMMKASGRDNRQALLPQPGVPEDATRVLRAQLILEEALETIAALGVEVRVLPDQLPTGVISNTRHVVLRATKRCHECRLEDIVDGLCDLQYVTVGTLMSCGVPDVPVQDEVNECNELKFPQHELVRVNAEGKFLKPDGWVPPNHTQHLNAINEAIASKELVSLPILGQLYAQYHQPAKRNYPDFTILD